MVSPLYLIQASCTKQMCSFSFTAPGKDEQQWGKIKPQTIGGQGDTKLLLPSASLWFDDFILFLFCADKGVSDGILAHGRKKWLIAKKQWKIRKHTQNFKKNVFHFQRTSRESLSSIASAFYNQIFSLLHRAVPLRHLQQYVFIWRWRAQMLLDINIENTMLLTQSGVCALKLFTNVLDFSSISCMSPSSRVLQHCT